jgi:hypothetical protein
MQKRLNPFLLPLAQQLVPDFTALLRRKTPSGRLLTLLGHNQMILLAALRSKIPGV